MKNTKIYAKIVADSVNLHGERITTMLLTYPRFIHGEVLTHRMFSRNSASSRAIPFEKMVKMVEKDPFIPIAWQKDHKGMQGIEYFTDESQINSKISCWLNARDHALRSAKYLNSDLVVHKIGDETFISYNQTDEDNVEQLMAEKRLENTKVTKQLCNRLLEPFMWHTVLITGSKEGWDNFFELRCPQYSFDNAKFYKSKKEAALDIWGKEQPDNPEDNIDSLGWFKVNRGQAEIHMQALAEAMFDAMNESTPRQLEAGMWHYPFHENMPFKVSWEDAIKISVARAARLSYMTFDGEIDYEKDIQLHDQLLASHHMSPFEHCARAMSEDERAYYYKSDGPDPEDFETGWCRNFRGWIQYRHLVENGKEI